MDEEARERKRAYDRARAREYRLRIKSDPVRTELARERQRTQSLLYRTTLRADPERLARFREKHRLAEAKRRQFNTKPPTPQQKEAARDRTRRYRLRVRTDPAKYASAIAKRRESQNAYYRANRDRLVERQRAYTDRNRQLIYARNREYAAKNREKIRKQQHEAYVKDLEANRAKDRERGRKRYAENPKAFNDYMKKWRAANPERARAYVRLAGHRRRAAAGGERIRVEDWERLLAKHNGRCAYCGVQTSLIEADHRVPLSRGGKNTIANILPACRSCNRRKRTKTEDEFRAWLAELATESGTVKARKRGGLAEAAGPYRTAV